MRQIVVAIAVMQLSGCMLRDQDPYSRGIAWQDATIANLFGDSAVRLPYMHPGTNHIFEITSGYYRGKRTTAHSSHDTVYLITQKDVREGDHLAFSAEDGTLDYDGFAGYWARDLDTNSPASGEMTVRKVSSGKIKADVRVLLHYRVDRKGKGVPFTIKDTVTFTKQTAPKCRTKGCTLSHVPREE